MIRLVFICLAGIVILLILSWNHILPGGWFLRNLIEDPHDRAQRLQREHSDSRLHEFSAAAADTQKINRPILMLGSSTIERYPPELLSERAINRGIGGESTEELLARLDQTLPAEVWPNVDGILLYAGSIDFRKQNVDLPQAMIRVVEVVKVLKKRAPKAKVLVLQILPGRQQGGRSSGDALEVDDLHSLLWFKSQPDVDFLKIRRPPLVEKNGTLSTKYSVDDWHLNREGYKILTEWIKKEGGAFSASLN